MFEFGQENSVEWTFRGGWARREAGSRYGDGSTKQACFLAWWNAVRSSSRYVGFEADLFSTRVRFSDVALSLNISAMIFTATRPARPQRSGGILPPGDQVIMSQRQAIID
jgi:hypothetical protein